MANQQNGNSPYTPAGLKKSSEINRKSVVKVLEKCKDHLKWEDFDEKIIDVGCGDGTTTFEVLYPFVAQHVGQFVAADKSPYMLAVAMSNCKYRGVSFEQLDVTKMIKPQLKETFDKVFSFFCTQYVSYKGKKWVGAFHRLLKPRGRMVVTITVTNPWFDIIEDLANCRRWCNYLGYVRSPTYTCDKPLRLLRDALKIGFDTIHSDTIEDELEFTTDEEFKEFALSINCFADKIPQELREEYVNTFVTILTNRSRMSRDPVLYRMSYSYAYLVAEKIPTPLN